ncbi:ABC transporter transmembrane domain-containing protein [Rhodoplanes sp. TEM]|uniref:ABC transporter transmembrane domain-containing protein n=1 Tax=Rhodoplanes tepidamans TaxID=200616 RepID=A0ABT5JEL1_RHOTP|nr:MULTISPECIES: ABC transporter transmembrane domain-containing protein [Rhodoplanes]MDC7788052.1 ABC transporter transmembrane domain-containing protein [Rhodoplanes tepidamans]MDC7987537.1 ABC transporter transmembrane domain-containing protein [Rhodoplanes sp. TEM]MDQ0353959.1 ATP-binding cassette subfamily B protein [Rhodoplanes tepidamans]
MNLDSGGRGLASSTSPAGRPPEDNRRNIKPLLAVVPYVMRYKGRALAALISLVVASLATLVLPVAVRRMIDFGFTEEYAGLIHQYFAVLILVAAVLAGASAMRYYLVTTLGERIVADLRARVFEHLTGLSASFFDSSKSGELVSRLSADTTQLKSAVGASVSITLRNLMLFIGSTLMMVVTSPRLSLFVLIVIPVIVLPLVAFGRVVRRRSREAQDTLAEASSYAAELIGAIRTLQAFTNELMATRRFGDAVERACAAAFASTKARAWLTGIAIFLVFASVVVILWVGAQDVYEQRITAGRLSQFVIYAVFAAGALGELSQVWGEISQAAGAAERLQELLTIRPDITAPASPAALPVPPRGEVAFEQVRFSYPTRRDATALDDVSFRVRPGEKVAIVGPSGAGKSTVFHLLLRFYDPQAGSVTFDGVRLAEADPRAVRSRIALVPQDAAVFAASVAENIRFGRPDASDAEIARAAEQAAASDFVARLPQGMQTQIGERGVLLSGGERQRLAIARAILREAPLLLLDEATSSLDAENETLVKDALGRLMEGRTTLVIAHRLATVLSCDRILVMDQGRIVEEGTHDSLVARGGLYARLARLQFETGAEAVPVV